MSPIIKKIAALLLKIEQKVKQLLTLRASKHEIALGVAIGVFVGVFPTFGAGALLLALIAPFFKFNITAAIIGTFIANPLTSLFWISLSCSVVGIDYSTVKNSMELLRHLEFAKFFGSVSVAVGMYFVGNLIVSTASGLLSYAIARLSLQYYFHRRKYKLIKAATELKERDP
ncbi:MAG TPA: DUF2062 domain-containing protein [Chitinispirillaceae bacterium]|nr:DUF2062 domain-containing protein [Chitinispirillaceae bacterium]